MSLTHDAIERRMPRPVRRERVERDAAAGGFGAPARSGGRARSGAATRLVPIAGPA